jgi:hypothetical protein
MENLMKYLLATLTLVIASFAQSQNLNRLDGQMKLAILGALIESPRVKSTDKNYLVKIFDSQGKNVPKYSINSFECNFLGRSLRFECQMQLGYSSKGENTDIISIYIMGFQSSRPTIQSAEFSELIK